MVIPAIAPVLRPPEECGAAGAGVEMEDEEGTTEETGFPDGRGDSAGKGSPNNGSVSV